MRIGFLGFGEAARAFRDSLAEADAGIAFSAWDIALERDPGIRAAMAARGVAEAEGPAALGSADWIFSAVTADQSLVAALSLLPGLGQGAVVFDINSVSPGRKRETAARVEAAGAVYVDMAVMAPVHPHGHRTKVLLAGAHGTVTGELARLGFVSGVAGDEPGQATAIKMIRSLFVKGLEAITVEALLAAKASGCFEEIHGSLSGSFPGLGWPEHAEYEFERTLRHGVRRAAEMRESAATLAELGLHGALATEIAAVQEAMGRVGLVDGDGLEALAGRVLAARLGA